MEIAAAICDNHARGDGRSGGAGSARGSKQTGRLHHDLTEAAASILPGKGVVELRLFD